jgi:2-iminobutanoate/2-iminopropanoate deaminase
MQRFKFLRAAIVVGVLAIVVMAVPAGAQSPNGVKAVNPPGAIKTTGTWGVASRGGDFVFVAGMRGIDPRPIRWCRATRRGSSRLS